MSRSSHLSRTSQKGYTMTNAEREKRLEELERRADELGCCIIPAVPVPPPEEER